MSRRQLWHPCIVVGLLLIPLAAALGAHREDPRPAGGVVPLVNLGSLPPEPFRSADAVRAVPFKLAGSRLQLTRLGLDAPITAVKVVGNVMQVPRDPHTVGWWTGGAAPGATQGNIVIVGHVNFAGVSGALAALPRARPGDFVVIAGDRDHRYRIRALRSYPKQVGIPPAVFSRAGPPRLILITCGGRFDAATGSYQDNVVAYASPV